MYMKKIEQNILAKNSNKEIAYLCSKCGKEVDKEATRCIHCGAKLGNIRCPFCNFTGTVNDFSEDTCPRCGRKNISKGSKINRIKTITRLSFFQKYFWLLFALMISLIVIVIILFIILYDII